MDEPYRIEVLHIVNPHVMFIESQAEGVRIKQVGIYGVIPVNKTIDIDDEVVTERCENWPVAAKTFLQEFLAQYDNVAYFKPIQTHERSTIFDEDIYQFGDIIVIEGMKHVSITDHLIKLSVAIKDECLFQQKLSSGTLKIKLNNVRGEQVLSAIKKYYQKQKKVEHDWQKTIKKHTTLHQESMKICAELTERNLKTHTMNVMATIDRKDNDLKLCKDADLQSVGCATRRRSDNVKTGSQSLEDEKNNSQPLSLLNDMKKYFVTHGQAKNSYDDFLQKSDNTNDHSTPLKSDKDSGTYLRNNLEKHSKDEHKIHHKSYKHQDLSFESDCQEESSRKKCNANDFEERPQQSYCSESTRQTYSGRGRSERLMSSRGRIVYGAKHASNVTKTCEDNLSQHDENGFVKEPTKRPKMPSKPRERLLVFCPDIEMSNENLQQFIPQKIVEDFTTGSSSPNVSDALKDTAIPTLVDDDQDSNVNIEITVHDKKKKHVVKNNCDEIDSQIEVKNVQVETRNVTKVDNTASTTKQNNVLVSSILRKKLQALKQSEKRQVDSLSSNSETSMKDTSTDTSKVDIDGPKSELGQHNVEIDLTKKNIKLHQSNTSPEQKQLEKEVNVTVDKEHLKIEPEQALTKVQPKLAYEVIKAERNVDPFKNLDGSKSVFVEKLITPILMVHTKNDNLILPQSDLRDIPFKHDTHCVLKGMKIHKPKRLQSVSWSYILRGHSVFLISPAGNGKTLGYLPAVCDLVTDSVKEMHGVGPKCVIVCATALSVTEIETYCKRFLDIDATVIACYNGMDFTKITTSLLNGCHILICTAPMFVKLLEVDFGVDLRRLITLVLDDCERLSQAYNSDVTKILQHVKNMLKNRSDKSLKVQYVLASRQWCDFMTSLAKNAPDTIIAIGASQECVLYSKTKTSVSFVLNQDSKVNAVVEFMKEIDTTKRTIIVCREDHEVDLLERTLRSMKHTVFSCNSTMTVHDLYKLNEAWGSYQEPVLGPVLICCDGNLTHFNITNANYLVHYSMPALFSMFCKRFSVLNENYSTIFGPENENVKIKILLDETNVEQLPKILHFVKRCTQKEFPMLDKVLEEVMEAKDLKKAENLTPICNSLLMLGQCIDIWSCQDRHTGFNEFDDPKDWMPKQGVVTFKIIHYDSAVTYSVRLLGHVTQSETIKYPNNYQTLPMKIGRYYSKESNRKMHGVPKVGDICAVAVKQNFFERCKVMKVMPIDNRNCHVLINLIDEEQLTIIRDVQLYHLPDDLKAIETYVVKIRLANLKPKDNDVTFSVAAKDHVQRITERDYEQNLLYVRGRVTMALGNCIFVDSAEACADLSSLGETIVKCDLRKDLLEQHAELNPQHIINLKRLRGAASVEQNELDETTKIKKLPRWAHLDKNEFSTVYFANVIDADTIFVRQTKFDQIVNLMLKDIEEYAAREPELAREEIYVGNIILAEFPDDNSYERARIDEIGSDNTAKCFFVDNGDWRHVSLRKLKPITDYILHRLPFQAIECRLIGIKPPGDANYWPEFSTHWLDDNYCYEDENGKMKCLYTKYLSKENASITEGHKYAVVIYDTSYDKDVVINKMMIELNLAKKNEDEWKYIDEQSNVKPVKATDCSSDEDDISSKDDSTTEKATPSGKDLIPFQSNEMLPNEKPNTVARNILFEKPIRSVPLVDDSDSDILDKWDVVVDKQMLGMFGQSSKTNVTEHKDTTDKDKTMSPEKQKTRLREELINGPELTLKNVNAVNNDTKTAGRIRCVSSLDNSKDLSQPMSETTLNLTQSDSDDTDIGNDKIEALNNFKNKLCSNEITEKKEPELVKAHVIKKSVMDTSGLVGYNGSKELSKNETLDSDDFSSVASEFQRTEGITKSIEIVDAPRKPKLVWRQDNKTVTVKINLIGVEDYDLEIEERALKFNTWHNDTTYKFDIELYSVIKLEKSSHANKGQYIQVNLTKMLQRNWLNFTKDFSTKKWIVYDVDAIDLSSDEDEHHNDALSAIKQNHERVESSEDEDLTDDLSFHYKKKLYD